MGWEYGRETLADYLARKFRLEKKGYLGSIHQRDGKSLRKVYRATPAGRKALSLAKSKVRELFRELIERR